MKKRFLAFLLCFAMAFSLMSVTAFACGNDEIISGRTGTIHGNEVNLRSGHGTGFSSGGTLNTDDTMWVTKSFTDNNTIYKWYYGTVTYCSKPENIGLNGWVAGTKGSHTGFITF